MNGAGKDHKHWSQVAEEWVAWAREPNHDAFWAYRASLAAFIGRGNGKALDVGCGEGRISRELTACGFKVTAVDPVSPLLRAAIELNPHGITRWPRRPSCHSTMLNLISSSLTTS
jgi:2-polyprenyl-3-methyl-5-hydroxy-6-metoxy-1,4-benzoquinol methylase